MPLFEEPLPLEPDLDVLDPPLFVPRATRPVSCERKDRLSCCWAVGSGRKDPASAGGTLVPSVLPTRVRRKMAWTRPRDIVKQFDWG